MGEHLNDFGIHKDLICHYSPCFKAAFNFGFEEATSGIIKLPGTEADIFELSYHWLYTQEVDLLVWDQSIPRAETKSETEKSSDCEACTEVRQSQS